MDSSLTKNSCGTETYLFIALGLTTSFMLIEIIAGFLLGSLALLSDAAHMFTDVIAIAIALTAIQITKRSADKKRTFGYFRFEILAAALNAIILIGVSLYIFYEAYERYTSPHNIQPIPMGLVASVGLCVNWISVKLLRSSSQDNLNVKGAYLEAFSDMISSIGVIIAAVIIYFTHWHPIDSLVATGIALWILPRTWILLKESINILLEGVPEGIELQEIFEALIAIPGVQDVHDLHIWALTNKKVSLTVHLVIDKKTHTEQFILQSATNILENQFKILHSTIQIEFIRCNTEGTMH